MSVVTGTTTGLCAAVVVSGFVQIERRQYIAQTHASKNHIGCEKTICSQLARDYRCNMAKTTVLFTSIQYKLWLAAAKERYGQNKLDWPPHIRAYHNKIEIVKEVQIELAQGSFPYSNTGVTSRGDYDK